MVDTPLKRPEILRFHDKILNVTSFSCLLLLVMAARASVAAPTSDTFACPVFCKGPLLDTVQRRAVFPHDSKHFVDCPMKAPPDVILDAFAALGPPADISNEDLHAFVAAYFSDPGSELTHVTPSDFSPAPARITDNIKDSKTAAWALKINELWKLLGRKVSDEVQAKQNQHSLLWVPHLAVVPGGRFRELYYWDTYWVVRGLIVSEMRETACGVVLNLLHLLKQFGFVPNGSRSYYLTRSQPPLLSEMLRVVVDNFLNGSRTCGYASGNDLLKEWLPVLETEYHYWTSKQHSITLELRDSDQQYTLQRYHANTSLPRPESYREDVELGDKMESSSIRKQLYCDIASAAESGWDFSSRWLKAPMKSISSQTSNIVPVELNAYLYKMEKNMAYFHGLLGNTSAVEAYRQRSTLRAHAMDAVLWDNNTQAYRDRVLGHVRKAAGATAAVYDVLPHSHEKSQSASDFVPIWTVSPTDPEGCTRVKGRMIKTALGLLNSTLVQVGGILTTSLDTGQQWDAPNAWPPLQHMLIEGMAIVGSRLIKEGAGGDSGRILCDASKDLARRWLHSGYLAFQKHGFMYEKYDATHIGVGGGGGEYTPQTGFGWTNGVALDLLDRYPDLRVWRN